MRGRVVHIGAICIVSLCLSAADLPAQGRHTANDPYFRFQASFGHAPGTDSVPLYSNKQGSVPIQVAAGVPLEAESAWAISTGSRDVVVAVLDDGFFYTHEDLEGNFWKNSGESGVDKYGFRKESNGVDDDGNGFVDDVVGWDFAFDDPDPDPYVFDGMDRSRIQPYWHSISALGIIGARGDNGVGVAGVNWSVSMMLLKIGAQGTRRTELDSLRADRASRAIRYAADNGARIINWSGFITDNRPDKIAQLRASIDYAGSRNVLIVAGAGNEANDLDRDSACVYPQCFEAANLIKVAEVDFSGELYRYSVGGSARGSNYGKRRVQIAAIGANFTTFLRNNQSTYALSGGTSNAGPVVAGVAALVLSVRPGLSASELRELLMDSATQVKSLEGKVESGGVVNAFRALRMARDRYR